MPESLRQLTIRLARSNAGRDVRRILGELQKLAVKTSRSSVRRVPVDANALPDPGRDTPKGVQTTRWCAWTAPEGLDRPLQFLKRLGDMLGRDRIPGKGGQPKKAKTDKNDADGGRVADLRGQSQHVARYARLLSFRPLARHRYFAVSPLFSQPILRCNHL